MIKIAIVGATGAVGREILSLLCSFKKKILLDLFASKKSIGKKIYFNKKSFTLKDTDKNREICENYDVCFFCVGKEFSKKYGKVASKKTIVIDNSSFFRQDKNVPLIIPEINKEKIKNKTLLSNPNCTTAIASIPLWVLHKSFGLKKSFYILLIKL